MLAEEAVGDLPQPLALQQVGQYVSRAEGSRPASHLLSGLLRQGTSARDLLQR